VAKELDEPVKRPHAVRVPIAYRPAAMLQAGGPDSDSVAIGREFGPLLDPATASEAERARPRVRIRDDGPWRFLSLDPTAFPEDGLKRPYYRWESQPNGVLYGYLIASDAAPAPGEATFEDGPAKG
jgi:hypothetical protein